MKTKKLSKDFVRMGLLAVRGNIRECLDWWSEGVQLSPERDARLTVSPDCVDFVVTQIPRIQARLEMVLEAAKVRQRQDARAEKPAKKKAAKKAPRKPAAPKPAKSKRSPRAPKNGVSAEVHARRRRR